MTMNIKVFVCNPFFENTYVVYDDQTLEAAIIDCGCLGAEEEERLKSFIESEHLTVKYLLNTHLHLDHQFGNYFASKTFGVSPMAHTDDLVLVDTFQQQCALFGVPVEVHRTPVEQTLNEGEEIHIGNFTLQVLHVPGHTAGSICFLNAKDNILFSGDALFKGSIGRTDLPGGNHPQLVKGIREKILTLYEDTIVLSGHGEHTTVQYEKYNNPYL